MRDRIASLGKQSGAAVSVGLHRLFGSRADGRFAILMYHRVAPQRLGLAEPTWNVTPERFRTQMRALRQHGVPVTSLRSAVDSVRDGRSLPPGTAIITFDDGYYNNYLHAWPVLREYGISATIFVPTSFVGSQDPLPFDPWGQANHARVPAEDWRAMSWTQCREMEASGVIEIGSHSHRHVDFRGDATFLRRDLEESVAALKAGLETSRSDFAFSFPYGSRELGYVNDELVGVVRDTHMICALTTETELASAAQSPFEWGRLEIVQSDDGASIAAKIAGWYEWMGRARALFRRVMPPRAGLRRATVQ